LNYSELEQLLSTTRRVVITTHRSPDGDAIGSSTALYQILSKRNHDVSVIVPDAFPKFLSWMDPNRSICQFDTNRAEAEELIGSAEVIFSLDYNTLGRVGDVGQLISKSNATKVLIDHHLSPDSGFDFILSDTTASSTAQLVFDFAAEMNMQDEIDVPTSESLYAGIVTDTGSFRFPSTSAHTHEIVMELMRIGLKPESIHQKIYDTNNLSRLRLIGYALSQKLEVDAQTQTAIIPLSLEEKNRFKYIKGDTEGLVNYGLSIEGVRMAVFMSEELNAVKFSFRSKGDVDVNQFARSFFNGGGHKNAAGGKLDLKLSEAIDHLKKVLHENNEL
jgi:bifunctional oligoribonuclease and PAP phosphatase NrnA